MIRSFFTTAGRVVSSGTLTAVFSLLLASNTVVAQNNNFSLQFNGTNSYVGLPAASSLNFSGNSAVTFEAQCFYTGSSSNSSFFGKAFSEIGTTQFCLFIDGNSQKITFSQDDFTRTGWQTVVVSNRQAPKNRWFHVAVVKTANTVTLFIDGDKDATGNIDAPRQGSRVSTGAVSIAKSALGASFAGQLDDVRFWGSALSDNTIRGWKRRELNNTHPDKGSLLAWYKMDEGTGRNVGDSGPSVRGGGNPLNGYTQGNPTWVGRKSEREGDDDHDKDHHEKH